MEVYLPIQRGGETHTMGDHQKTAPGSRHHVAGELKNFIRGGLIEIPGGLIGEQQKWFHRQCASDGHALLLTAGQLFRIALEQIA
jgi:hypothetical protein